MPIYNIAEPETENFAAKADRNAAGSDSEARAFAVEYITGAKRTPGVAIGMTIGGSVVDLIDTAASSVIPGVERESVNKAFLGAIGNPGLMGWYDENKAAIEVGSGIAGTIAAAMIADRVLRPAGLAMKTARKIPWVKNIATLDAQYANALRVAQLTNMETARRGAMGVERFIGTEMNLARLGAKALTVTPAQAARGVRRATIAKGLALNVTTEAIMATTLRTNSFLYDDDLAHNLAWSAAGLGIGAGIDRMVGNYTLRKMANSGAIRRLNAAAYDPSGKETQRLQAAGVADAIRQAADVNNEDFAYLFSGSGAITDTITSKAIQAQELRKRRSDTERGRSLFSRREALATPIEDSAFVDLNKVTVRGLRGVRRAGFGTKLEGLGAPIKEGLDREPAFLHGIEELGTEVDNLGRVGTAELRDKVLSERRKQVEELLLNDGKWISGKAKVQGKEVTVDELVPLNPDERIALQAEARELDFAQQGVPVFMLEPGEWAPMSLAKVADEYTPKKIEIESIGQGKDSVKLWSLERAADTDPVIGIRSDGELFLPANTKLERLQLTDMISLYHVGNRMIRNMVEAGQRMIVPQNPTWFHLDLAEQMLKATDDTTMVQFPGGMTRESAMVESFAQKVDAIRVRQRAVRMAKQDLTETMAFSNKIYFNLPRLTSYQQGLMQSGEHPFDLMIGAFKSGDEVRKMPYTELLKGMQDSKKIAGMTDDTLERLDSIQGNSFNFLLDRDGNNIKPIIGIKRPMSPQEWSQESLFVRQATAAMYVRDKLMGESADEITREMLNVLTADPAFVTAGRLMELADDQQRSSIPLMADSAPQSTGGAFANAVTGRERRDVDSMTLLAASRIKELQTRITQETMRRIITEAMGDTISQVNSPRNVTAKLGLNQFHSFRQGWELVRKPVEETTPGGVGYAFVLDHESALNKKRFEEAYGRPLTKGQKLMNPNGQVIVLNEMAMDVLTRMQKIHEATIAMKNTLLRSQNLPEIKSVPWYAPPPPTKNKFIGYTFNSRDEVVPGMTVIADTAEELGRMKAEMVSSPQWKNGYTFRQRNEVEAYMDLWDKAQMDYIAPNVTAIQSKKNNFGRTGGNQINMSAFDEALVTMRDSMIMHGDDILETLFREQLKSADARAKIARVESAAGTRTAEQHSSIYDRYIQNLTGRSSLGAKDSYTGGLQSWAEKRLNGWLASPQASTVADTYQALKDHISVMRPRGDKASVERFNKLSNELGQYMPFKSAMEMVERETGSRTPKEVADITSQLSWFEAASRLRWFESMHAVANIGGILTNMPAILRALQPMKGESIQDAAMRNASLSMMMVTPGGKEMAVPNVPKLLWHSMKDAWNAAPDEFTRKAIARGYMDQEVAEFNRTWGAIDSRDGWRRFVFGDGITKKSGNVFSVEGVVSRSKAGGLDYWAGVVSDKSEAFTRQWGMYAGRRVAQAMGIENVDHQLAFAHEITNKLIANYDPRNRPEVFQGALGAPIGLFQSYVMNYYQRMFRYLETRDHRALATQYAAQAGVFGMQSVPGWSALNWAFFDQQQAENEDPVDSLYRRFGQFDGDLLMHGSLSNLPKIFGADGISLYTRGDTQIRLPIVPTPEFLGGNGEWGQIPVADTIGRVWRGLGMAIDQAKVGPIGINQAAEILSNVMTNRPIAGMIETFAANGYDTSFDGQVVSESRSLMEQTYRVLGVRSMGQQKEVEMFYQNRNAQEEQGARRDILSSRTRAAIRDGRIEELPGLYAKFVEQGGDPRGYSRWLKESFKAAKDTRGERMLEKALKDKDNAQTNYLRRLLDSGIGIAEDEAATEDYGQQAEIDRLIQQGWETDPLMRPEDEEPWAVEDRGF